MMRTRWIPVVLALLVAAGSMAGEISRVEDLQTFAGRKQPGNTHASLAPGATWSYLLVKEHGKFQS